MNFYDFETFDLVSFSDKTNQPISSIQFDVEGSSLFCLSGENVRQITWEPSSLLNTWVLLHKFSDDNRFIYYLANPVR